jgi:hypothetical protein
MTWTCSDVGCQVVNATQSLTLEPPSTPSVTLLSCDYNSTLGLTNFTLEISHTGTQFSLLNLTTPTSIAAWSLTDHPPLPFIVENSTSAGTSTGSDSSSGSEPPSMNDYRYFGTSRYFITHIAGDDEPWSLWFTIGGGSEGTYPSFCNSSGVVKVS